VSARHHRYRTPNVPVRVHGAATVDRYLRLLDDVPDIDLVRFDVLEVEFITVARRFAQESGVTYGAWRDVGVSARVLARAGIVDA